MSFSKRLELHRQAMSVIEVMESKIGIVQSCLTGCLSNGGRAFACGNGGSAAEAQHFMTELSGRYRSNRRALSGLALTSDGATLTCIGNDFGWENMFARQVEAFGRKNDILFAMSTSGNSINVLRAVQAANEMGMVTVGLLGKGGGSLSGLVTHSLVVDSMDTGAIQEVHLVLIHMFCEALENADVSA
jgi:D-sedoheptulose 7-phosphate isomerase